MSDKNIPDIASMFQVLFSEDTAKWVWEPDTGALYFNKSYMEILGYEHNAFPYHISTWENLIHPEDRKKTVSDQFNLINDPSLGECFECRYRIRKASGEYIWVMGRGFVMCRNEAGRAIRICGMHFDLEFIDRKKEEIILQRDRMSFALEAARDGIWDWNPGTEHVYFSPRYISMLGYTPEQFPPHVSSWVNRVHPEDLSATVEMQYAHINDPSKGDIFDCVYRFLAADGSYRWILGRGKITRRDNNGKALRVVGLHTDITELHNTQEELSVLLNTDTLTGLKSRFFFENTLNKLLSENSSDVSLIFCDVDGLKLINDNLGHVVGDRVLIAAAGILRENAGNNAFTARIGGDEFAVILSDDEAKHGTAVLKRIAAAIEKYNASSHFIPVFISMGVVSSIKGVPLHKLFVKADMAMLRNKSSQRSNSHKIIKEWIEKQTEGHVTDFDERLIDK